MHIRPKLELTQICECTEPKQAEANMAAQKALMDLGVAVETAFESSANAL